MGRNPFLPLILIAALVAGGWYFRGPLLAYVHPAPPPAPASVAARADTVYRWVDQRGAVHFDQNGGAGRQALAVDPHRIQSLQALTPHQRETPTAGAGHPHQYYEP